MSPSGLETTRILQLPLGIDREWRNERKRILRALCHLGGGYGFGADVAETVCARVEKNFRILAVYRFAWKPGFSREQSREAFNEAVWALVKTEWELYLSREGTKLEVK